MLIIIFRTLILYLMVVIVMRIMGKTQIGQLQPFELVVALIISELASIPMENTEIPLLNGIIPILTLLFAQMTLAYLSLKSEKCRAIICGRPSILIEKGRINEKELKYLRMNINDLLEQLRVKNYPNIWDVDYAILETNGQLSVIPKGTNRPIITRDLDIKAHDSGLPITLVMDGTVIEHNLRQAKITQDELLEKLKEEGIESLKDLFFVSLDQEQNLIWQKKEESK